MIGNFTEVKPLRYWVQHILPLVYDDSLSYMELLGKVVNTLNEVVKNNNLLPDYIMELIKEYISSGEIEKVLAEVLANYMLNVKFPPAGLTPATGDGSADDTEALQGCIDYAYNNGGMSVYFPSGSYLTQPLTLRNKATLFGQDRYTTRLIMKGGATTAMFTGDVDELTLTGLGFDGNMDIQVNNVNLFTISVNSAIITNCLLTDGYDLLNVTVNDDLQLNDVIFRHAVENALVLKGDGIVQGNNLIFKSVSTLVGKNFVVMDVSKSILEQLKCYGASPNAVLINGSNNVVKLWNEQSLKAYTDNGVNNTVEVYTISEQKKLSGYKSTNVSGDLTETVGGNKTETITGNKGVSVYDLTETLAGNHTKTVIGNINESANNYKAVIQLAYELSANSLTEQLVNKEVNATNSTENLGSKTETITGEKNVNADSLTEIITNEKHTVSGSVSEDITGDKHVNAANIIETVQGEKTLTAGDISETAANKTVHITTDSTEQVDGVRTITVSGTNNETTGGRTEKVNGNKNETINGNEVKIITENKSLTVKNVEINVSGNEEKNITGNYTETVTGIVNKSANALDETYNTGTKTVNGNFTNKITGKHVENNGDKELTAFNETHVVTNMDISGSNHISFSTPSLRHGASIEWLQDGVKGVKGYNLNTETLEPYGVVTWIEPTLLGSKPDDYVTPEQYGAVGNGVTDDANAFQLAINTRKRIVLTRGKTYIIGSELQLLSGTFIDGCSAILKASDTFAGYTNIMMARDKGRDSTIGGYEQNSDIIIKDLILNANNRPLVGGIGIGHAHNIYISGCEFYNWASWHPIELNSTLNAIVTNCYFHDMFVEGQEYGECLQLDLAGGANLFNLSPYDNTPCRNIVITNNRFELPTSLHDKRNFQPACIGSHSTDGTNLFDHMHSNIIVANNVCYGAQTFVLATNWRNALISGNIASNIRCAVYSGSWDRLVVSDNNFYFIIAETFDGAYDRGVYTNASAGGSVHGSVTVKNNVFERSLSHCIALSGTICVVENNILRNPNYAGIYASYDANFTSVIGNTITGEVNSGYYGIYVNPLADTSPVTYVTGNVTDKMNCTGVSQSSEKSVIAYNLIRKSANIASVFTNVGNIIAGNQ